MKISILLRASCLCFFLSACSSYLTTAENISKTKQSYNKILVVGRSKDNTARVKFENSVVEQLQQNGVSAMASYSLDGAKDITKEYSEAQIAQFKQKLISYGVDGVIVTNLINTEQYTDVFESSFYRITNAPGDNLQWLGRFELKDPSSIQKTAENYAEELVKVLLKESITAAGK